MRISTSRVILGLCLLPSISEAQLYLIAGSTNGDLERFPSILLKVSSSGLNPVAEIVPLSGHLEPRGVKWIGLSYDWRKAVILSDAPLLPDHADQRVMVLDLDKAEIVKTCALPRLPDSDPLEQWLADVPGRGPSFNWFHSADHVQSMTLDSSVPCENSFSRVLESEEKYLVAHGTSGLAEIGSIEGSFVMIGESGRLRRGAPERQGEVSFDFQVPPEFLKSLPKDPFSRIVINDSGAMVLSVLDNATMADARLIAFRKSDRTWHTIPIRSDRWELRGFANFVAGVEARTKQAVSRQLQKHRYQLDINDEVRTAELSAGRAQWRKERGRLGPGGVDSFDDAKVVYPGKLHVYDINSEKLYTITTNQADSEILLIEDDTIYYRVSNQLYSAPITDSGVGSATLLATDEAIHDAHWAFIKH